MLRRLATLAYSPVSWAYPLVTVCNRQPRDGPVVLPADAALDVHQHVAP